MEYGLDADGSIIMTSFRKSQKIRNLERDPRAVLLFESGMRYQELMGVIAYCHAAIISDPHVVGKLMRLIRARDALRESMSPEMRAQVVASIPKRVAVCLTPFRFVSWDHGKLANSY